MNEEARELLRDEVLPILLGNGVAAHRFASRLSRRYGVACLLCAEHRNLLDLLDLNTGFYRLSRQSERLCAEQLSDLSELYSDRLLLLVPMSDAEREWLCRQAELLETRFVCVEPSELEEAWLKILGVGGIS